MSLISKDFRFREPEYHEPRHSKLRWTLFIAACTAIGVVVANTMDTTLKDSAIDGSDKMSVVSKPLLLNNQSSGEKTVGETTAGEITSSEKTRKTINLPSFVGQRQKTNNAVISDNINTASETPDSKLVDKDASTSTIANSTAASIHITNEASIANDVSASTKDKTANQPLAEEIITQPAPTFDKTTDFITPTAAAEASTVEDNDSRKSFSLILPEEKQLTEKENKATSSLEWREFEIKPGDSLAKLFSRANIKAQQLHELMKSGDDVKTLRKIFPKDIIRVQADDAGNLQALSYDINERSYLLVKRKNGRLSAQTFEHKIDTLTTHADGTIESSLFLAAQKSGISQNIIMQLASIFGWDIDFALDIRKGDKFTVVYEENYRDGDKISDGNILAAEFINQGKTYRAVRYTNPQTNISEYFTPEGKSMRKAFLRTPVNFSRISSRFSLNRYHPVLHKFRSHKGVDYAAKRGTPIRAAGDGKVIFKGRKGGYGRVVILQHGTKYTTLYAHLNSFNKKIKKGSRVKQGQTIAYLGSSGLATGPHLHYEFRVNGVHRNPLTVRLPESKPVPKRYLADFELMTKPAIAYLDSVVRNQSKVAVADKVSEKLAGDL